MVSCFLPGPSRICISHLERVGFASRLRLVQGVVLTQVRPLGSLPVASTCVCDVGKAGASGSEAGFLPQAGPGVALLFDCVGGWMTCL